MPFRIVKIPIRDVKLGMIILKTEQASVEFPEFGIPISSFANIEILKTKKNEHVYIWKEDIDLTKINPNSISLVQSGYTGISHKVELSAAIPPDSYKYSNQILKEVFKIVEHSKAIFVDSLANIRKLDRRNTITNFSKAIENIIFIARKYPYIMMDIHRYKTVGTDEDLHAMNVMAISLTLAHELKFNTTSLITIAMAALLHDIGNTRIPERLLRKVNAFTDEEFTVIRKHPEWGENILSRHLYIPEEVTEIVGLHHERLDGSGYPSRSRGNFISKEALIVGLAEDFENMVSGAGVCSYNIIHGTEAIKKLYSNAGKKFPATDVKTLIKIVGIYPLESLVQLSDDSVAVVCETNQATPIKPRVISYGVDAKDKAKFIDLSKTDITISSPISNNTYGIETSIVMKNYINARLKDDQK